MTFKQLKAAIKKADKEGVKPTSKVVICVQGPDDFFADGKTVKANVLLGQFYLSGTSTNVGNEEEDDDE